MKLLYWYCYDGDLHCNMILSIVALKTLLPVYLHWTKSIWCFKINIIFISPPKMCNIPYFVRNMLSKMPCYWYANVENIFLKSEKKKNFNSYVVCKQKEHFVNKNRFDGNNIFLIIFLWDFFLVVCRCSYWHHMTSIRATKIIFARIFHQIHTHTHSNCIDTSTSICGIWSGSLAHTKIKYCETCQLQFYLKPDGLLCFITLAYQHNHLSIAFED